MKNKNYFSLLCSGNELLEGEIENTHLKYLSQKITQLNGIIRFQLCVADQPRDLLNALSWLAQESYFIVFTGGLGPTSDDHTRTILAQWLDKPLFFDEKNWVRVKNKLILKHKEILDIQKRQSFFPKDSILLDNNEGIADGFWLKTKTHELIVLPGPTQELHFVWENQVEPKLIELFKDYPKDFCVQWTLIGIPESQVADLIESLPNKEKKIQFSYQAQIGRVKVKLKSQQKEVEFIKKMNELFQPWIESYKEFE